MSSRVEGAWADGARAENARAENAWAQFPRLVAQCVAGSLPVSELATAATDLGLQRAILVEGVTDRAAIDAVAALLGRRLDEEGVAIVSMGGAMSIGRYVRLLGPKALGLELSGLCDAGEERIFRKALESIGSEAGAGLELLGFGVCSADLEDELIRALGTDAVEQAIAAEGDLATFRTFQKQPYQRSQSLDRQLRRFFGSVGGRKERYAGALAAALDLAGIPGPLRVALERVR